MTELAPSPTRRLPPPLALWPELRRPAAHLHRSARTLTDLLLASSPVARLLARDRTIAEYTNTTPYDHLAADTVAAACHLLDTLEQLARPVTLDAPSPRPSDDIDL